MTHEVEEIKLDAITVIGKRLRQLNPVKVAELASSMGELGLLQPITVRERTRRVNGVERQFGYGYELIIGQHRLEAARQLGWPTIRCLVSGFYAEQKRLAEIDENLIRAELTELERAEHLSLRKKIYEKMYPETKQHVSGAVAANAAMGRGDATDKLPVASFVRDTAEKTGLSARTIERAVSRAIRIADEAKDEIRDMPGIADSGVELDALAKAQPEAQMAAVADVKAGRATNVRAVLASPPAGSKTATAPSLRQDEGNREALARLVGLCVDPICRPFLADVIPPEEREGFVRSIALTLGVEIGSGDEGRDWGWYDNPEATAATWLRRYPSQAQEIAAAVLRQAKLTAPRRGFVALNDPSRPRNRGGK